MDKESKVLLIALAGLFVFLFGVYIWPTCFMYTHTKIGSSSFPVRINRLSGETEILVALQGWKVMQTEEQKRAEALAKSRFEIEKYLPANEVEKYQKEDEKYKKELDDLPK